VNGSLCCGQDRGTDWRRQERRSARSSGVPHDNIVFSARTLFLFCSASFFFGSSYAYSRPSPTPSQKLQKPESPLPSLSSLYLPSFLFIFSQGCNAVSLRKERSKGKKTQFREINLRSLRHCSETSYINLPSAALLTSAFLPRLLTVATYPKLTGIRSGTEVGRGGGALKGIAVLVLSTIDW
jgi:hypothetical protein